MISQLKNKKFKPIKIPSKNNNHAPPTLLTSKKDDPDLVPVNLKPKITQHSSEDKKTRSKQGLCNELLKEGYIQSFIDMFYLSHKTLPNLLVNKNYFGEIITSAQQFVTYGSTEQQSNQSQMGFLSDLSSNLKKAETLSYYHSEHKESAMNEYNSLAFTYEDQGDYVTAVYFYSKVIELAKSSKHKQYQVVGLVGTAKCYDQNKQTGKAIEIYEQSLKQAKLISTITQRQNMVKQISKDLIDIYMKVAEEHQKGLKDYKNALVFYEKCLLVAQTSKEKDSQGMICYKIGELYYNNQQYPQSVQYQQKYLHIIRHHIEESKNIGDEGKQKTESSMKTKTMEAHASLAKCYLKMKQYHLAETHLTEYNQLAKQLKIQNALADSSYYLAKLHQQKGNIQRSIDYYKSYFEAAKSERPEKKNRNLVDKARVNLAIAKANQNMDKYIHLFKKEDSLKEVLDWKIKKELR